MIDGSKIRAVRKQKKITLRDLSPKVGVSFQHLSDIETGRYHASKPTLDAIRRELDLDENLEPIEKPERSAWNELTEIAILANPDVDFTPFHEWSGRYETELKNLPARGNNE